MGRQLVQQIIPAVAKMKYSSTETVNPAGYQVFAQGRDKVDSYRGDPRVLGDALRIFQTADSLPYEYAGVAYTLIAAAKEVDGSYHQEGLDAALEWLEKAQNLTPDVTDINAIEPFIYIYAGRFDDARLVLDYLHDVDPAHYYLSRAEIEFWRRQGEPQRAVEWSERAVEQAETVPQRLRVKSQMADIYAEMGELALAVATYKEALHFAPEDGELWQKAAAAYWQQEEYELAEHYNSKALELDPNLQAARELQAALKEKDGGDSSSLLGRLFG